MAENKETREVEIILKGQQANASLKEMGAAAAIMTNQLAKMAADDPGRAKLINDFATLSDRITATRKELKTYVQTEEEAAAETAELAKAQELLAQANEETVASGLKASASLREMKAAAGVLEQQLEGLAADDPGRAKLIADFTTLKARMEATRTEMTTYVKSEAELREEAEKLTHANQQIVLNGQKVEASFKDMRAAGALLERQLHELSANDPGRAKLLADYHALQERIAAVGKEIKQLPSPEEAGGGLKSVVGDALAFGGITVGIQEGVGLLKDMTAAVAETTQEFVKLRSSINTLTGASGPELDQLTAKVAAIAKANGKENQEILLAANSLSKQMGISQQESLRLISQGFLAGADASGEFLDQVKEYPAQFKAAGLSANEAIGIITQSVTTGVFSDKGADVIKEFNLRIREQTKATSDAMQAAFGEEFTSEIFDGIKNGSLTTSQALAKVAKEMDETKIPADRLQTVIADVFGGPGEDAGMDFLKSLKNVGKGVDEMVDKTNKYTQQQIALEASYEDLTAAQNAFAKEVEGTGGGLESLGNEAKAVGYTLLASLVVTFKELFKPLQEIWDSFMKLGSQLKIFSGEGITAKSVGEALGGMFRVIWTPAKLLYEALSWVVSGVVSWISESPKLISFLKAYTAPLQLFFDLLVHAPAYFEGFKAAASNVFGSVGRMLSAAFSGNFAQAKEEFMHMGSGAGKAFLDAYHKQIAESKKTSTPETEPATEKDEPTRDAGGDGQTAAEKAKAAEKAAKERAKRLKEEQQEREKADKEALEQAKKAAKDEADLLEMQWKAMEAGREKERMRVYVDTEKQYTMLTGQEANYTEIVLALREERQNRLKELEAKFAEEDEEKRLKNLDEQIEREEAETEERVAQVETDFASGVLYKEQYEEALYQVQLQSEERKLALVKKKNGEESAEYKKLFAEKLKMQADHLAKQEKGEKNFLEFKKTITALEQMFNEDNLKALQSVLGKQTIAYKLFEMTRKGIALASIAINAKEEISGIWQNAQANPMNAIVPGWGTAQAVVLTAFAVARAVSAASDVMSISAGFAQGGATGSGMLPAAGRGKGQGQLLLDVPGARVSTNGKLVDDSGHAIAGVVHENEYVIPAWMRADPEVMQVEQYLEARRTRGYAGGGETGPAPARALPTAASATGAEATDLGEVLERVVASLTKLDSRLEHVEEWQKTFTVELILHELERELENRKQAMLRGDFR